MCRKVPTPPNLVPSFRLRPFSPSPHLNECGHIEGAQCSSGRRHLGSRWKDVRRVHIVVRKCNRTGSTQVRTGSRQVRNRKCTGEPWALAPGQGHLSLKAIGHLRPAFQNQGPLMRIRSVKKINMFLLDVYREKAQSFRGKENLTSEEQRAFMTCTPGRFLPRKLEQPSPSRQGICTCLAPSCEQTTETHQPRVLKTEDTRHYITP